MNSMIKTGVQCFLLTVSLLAPVPAIPPPDQLDDYLRAEMAQRRIPGLAVAVVKDGQLIKSQGYGLANVETNSPVTSQSVFELASLTKPFTATAVMMLVEDGKLDLNQSVRKYVDGLPENWEQITVAHLLSHRSGLHALFPEEERPTLLHVTVQDQFSWLVKMQLLFPPGTHAQYSDPGYFLLGLMIEKVSGKRYGEFLSERIFKPLHMEATSLIDRWQIVRNRVSCYTRREDRLLNARRDFQIDLASYYGLMSTAEDLAKWDRALRESLLLKKETLTKMLTPATLDDGQPSLVFGRPYGLGWTLGEFEGHPIAEHGGFTGTHMIRRLDSDVTVIVLTNLDARSGSEPATLARGVLRLLSQ